MYVEDEILLRLATADAMREAGFAVMEAGTAPEAMAIMHSSGQIDVLMTDIRLPGPMDGVALAEKARAARPAMKVVVAAAQAPGWPARKFVDAFFDKPYDVARVVWRLRELLAENGK